MPEGCIEHIEHIQLKVRYTVESYDNGLDIGFNLYNIILPEK